MHDLLRVREICQLWVLNRGDLNFCIYSALAILPLKKVTKPAFPALETCSGQDSLREVTPESWSRFVLLSQVNTIKINITIH